MILDSAVDFSPDNLGNEDEPLSALPIWALALGLFSLLTFGLTSIPAIVCGHRALSDARSGGGGMLARRAAVVGLFVGYAGAMLLATVVTAVVRLQS